MDCCKKKYNMSFSAQIRNTLSFLHYSGVGAHTESGMGGLDLRFEIRTDPHRMQPYHRAIPLEPVVQIESRVLLHGEAMVVPILDFALMEFILVDPIYHSTCIIP